MGALNMLRYTVPKPRIHMADNKLTRPEWVKTQDRSNVPLWLDKNENTDLKYIQIVNKIISNIKLEVYFGYPDCSTLYNKLASYLNVAPNNLLLAAGSDGIIRAAFETFISPGDVVIYPNPTFAMYEVYCQIFGAERYPVEFKKNESGLFLDIDEFCSLIIRYNPKIVCLPNANSPTGTVVAEKDLISIIESSGKVGAVVLVDEAYYPFYNKTALPLITQYPHLVVCRSFSKAWGLAGARVGYAIAQNELITLMHKVRPMYELGALSLAIVEGMLDYADEMQDSVKRLNQGKEYFIRAMNDFGFKTLHSEGNFLHVSFGKELELIHEGIRDLVLYRKDFPNTVLSGYSRFSSTTEENFKQIVQRIALLLSKAKL